MFQHFRVFNIKVVFAVIIPYFHKNKWIKKTNNNEKSQPHFRVVNPNHCFNEIWFSYAKHLLRRVMNPDEFVSHSKWLFCFISANYYTVQWGCREDRSRSQDWIPEKDCNMAHIWISFLWSESK